MVRFKRKKTQGLLKGTLTIMQWTYCTIFCSSRKRKSRCEHVRPCAACIFHKSEKSCYTEFAIALTEVIKDSSQVQGIGTYKERSTRIASLARGSPRVNPIVVAALSQLPNWQDYGLAFECFFDDVSKKRERDKEKGIESLC